MIGLVDATSFYTSCEAVFNMALRNKPLIVLSNNDGIVVAANSLARAKGVEKFKPYFEVEDLCKRHGVIAMSSNYELYLSLSNRLMDVIGHFGIEQHIYSIDESFIVPPALGSLQAYVDHGADIRRTVWKECRLPVGVGYGESLTLAKQANYASKKLSGYQGVCVIGDKKSYNDVLTRSPVSSVWGVGSKLADKLTRLGIKTAMDLAKFPIPEAQRYFSVEMERVIRELRGERVKSWDLVKADKKQIFSTRSTKDRIVDQQSLNQAMVKHASIVARKAREQQSLISTMVCFGASSAFDANKFNRKLVHKFTNPTNDTTVVASVVSTLVEQIFKKGLGFYKVGVGALELVDEDSFQPDMFAEKHDDPRLMGVLDGLNQKYGADSVFVASRGVDQAWDMKRGLLTPRYTTRWRDLPRVKC
ncbi:Y-family DNA polymerase [Vibrio owensii]|uniref:Y-family DNA polymerase n=1 Tax=Vibrio owensii TaxID=696485 RepID=UPI0018F15244|nr:Y-family DNA polymerase [Vibrio owensii]